MTQSNGKNQNVVSTLLIVLVGQVGCLTLIIILGTLFGGLWLDQTFHTKPLFTLILLFAGIPLSVILMLFVGRRTLARIKSNAESEKKISE